MPKKKKNFIKFIAGEKNEREQTSSGHEIAATFTGDFVGSS